MARVRLAWTLAGSKDFRTPHLREMPPSGEQRIFLLKVAFIGAKSQSDEREKTARDEEAGNTVTCRVRRSHIGWRGICSRFEKYRMRLRTMSIMQDQSEIVTTGGYDVFIKISIDGVA